MKYYVAYSKLCQTSSSYCVEQYVPELSFQHWESILSNDWLLVRWVVAGQRNSAVWMVFLHLLLQDLIARTLVKEDPMLSLDRVHQVHLEY